VRDGYGRLRKEIRMPVQFDRVATLLGGVAMVRP
jgi:hypothetical protein